MGLLKEFKFKKFNYCVVAFDCDEDGPYTYAEVFETYEDACEWLTNTNVPCEVYELKSKSNTLKTEGV